MNFIEKEMLATLIKLKENFGCVGVKAEFEAEGVRLDEMLRLVELTYKADLKLAIKIGGCEAVKDINEAKQFGADYLIAPMIESKYALSKYSDSIKKTYGGNDFTTKFLFNIETYLAYCNANELVEFANNSQYVDGIVFGRVDFALSQSLTRADIETPKVSDSCFAIADKLKNQRSQLDFVVGGGISSHALPFLKKLNEIYLSRFETRKIIFDKNSLSNQDIHAGFLLAVKFELLWLTNKRDYYNMISEEDDKRILMLQDRGELLKQN